MWLLWLAYAFLQVVTPGEERHVPISTYGVMFKRRAMFSGKKEKNKKGKDVVVEMQVVKQRQNLPHVSEWGPSPLLAAAFQQWWAWKGLSWLPAAPGHLQGEARGSSLTCSPAQQPETRRGPARRAVSLCVPVPAAGPPRACGCLCSSARVCVCRACCWPHAQKRWLPGWGRYQASGLRLELEVSHCSPS